jgi:hypothetical protein
MSNGEGGTGPLQSDPPVLVGGGGSTLIWIRKDQKARPLPLVQVPGTAEKPAHPDQYEIYILDDFVCSKVRVHDGGAGHSVPHPTQGKKHHVMFE